MKIIIYLLLPLLLCACASKPYKKRYPYPIPTPPPDVVIKEDFVFDKYGTLVVDKDIILFDSRKSLYFVIKKNSLELRNRKLDNDKIMNVKFSSGKKTPNGVRFNTEKGFYELVKNNTKYELSRIENDIFDGKIGDFVIQK